MLSKQGLWSGYSWSLLWVYCPLHLLERLFLIRVMGILAPASVGSVLRVYWPLHLFKGLLVIRVMGVLAPASVGGITLELCCGCTGPCICWRGYSWAVLWVYWPLCLLQCPQSDCEYSCSDGKGIWQLGVKILQKSCHTTLSHSHKIFMGGREPRKVIASARVRDSRELNKRQCLYGISWGWNFPEWPGNRGVMWPDLGASSEIVGIFFL